MTLDLIDEIYSSSIPNHSFIISTLIQSLKKIGQKMLKIESGNKFLTSIKGHNSGLNCQNLPIFNPKPLLLNINSYTKFEENLSKMIKIESGNELLTSIKGHNSGLN